MCPWYSFILLSVDQPTCPVYTRPHSDTHRDLASPHAQSTPLDGITLSENQSLPTLFSIQTLYLSVPGIHGLLDP